jgi:hypothetical protein
MTAVKGVGIYLHIPRTGGTSLRLLMERNYQQDEILPIYSGDIEHPERMLPTEALERGKLRMVRGHIPYGIHAHILWARCYYFTVLRDPVDRVWSLWRYAKRHRSHHLAAELNRLGTLGAALERGVSVEFNNGMCRQISGLDGVFPQKAYAKTTIPYGEGEAALSQVALDHFFSQRVAMGVLEHLDRMAAMLADTFGWVNADLPREHVNAGIKRKPGDLTEREIELIHQLNHADMVLWQAAREESGWPRER